MSSSSSLSLLNLSDEAKRKLLKPAAILDNNNTTTIIDAVYEHFGIPISIIKQLDSYDDVNYLVKTTSNEQHYYLLKIHNGVESADYIKKMNDPSSYSTIDLQNAMMQVLNSDNQNDVNTSNPIPTKHTNNELAAVHELPVVSSQHSPQPLVIRLLTWMEGTTMASYRLLPVECLYKAGVYLGKINTILDTMCIENYAPASCRSHAWDGKHTADLRNYVDCIVDTKRQQLVKSIMDAFEHDIMKSGDYKKFQTGILQADYNDANIVLKNDSSFEIAGVIDFGDSVASWRVLDISVAMAYAMLSQYGKHGRMISAAACMLRGYTSIYKQLSPTELHHLPLLICCRLACSASIGAFSYQQNPENKYLLLHSEPAWRALETIWGYNSKKRRVLQEVLHSVFDRAIHHPTNTAGDDSSSCTDLTFPDYGIVDPLVSIRVTTPTSTSSSTVKQQQQPEAVSLNNDRPVITFVTGNKKKLEEVKRILGSTTTSTEDSSSSSAFPFEISNHKLDLPELQGDEPIDIAKSKCSEAAKQLGCAVITEDTSLCFTALHGLPGVYIKWFLEKCGHEGLNNLIASYDDKSAYAQTVVAFCPGPGQDVVVFDGRTMGKIVPARGKLDFGWDPIFEPDEGGGLTYGEMSKEAKDAISHRSRAFAKLRDYFMEETDAIASSIAQGSV